MRFRGLFFILMLPWLAPAAAHAGDGAAGLAFVSR
jgi:mono/diheme cytochrome c family protein